MLHFFKKLHFILILVCFITSIQGFAESIQLDPVTSSIGFKIGHLTFSSQKGVFTDFTGKAEINSETKRVKNLKVNIVVKSITTKNPERDEHLLNKDFFYASQYPYIIFNAQDFEYNEKNQPTKISGTLNMRGVSKKVDFSITDWKDSNENIKFKATTRILRKDYGINYGVNAAVGNEVTITIQATALRKPNKS